MQLSACILLIEILRRGTIGTLRMLAIREHRFPFLRNSGARRADQDPGGPGASRRGHPLVTLGDPDPDPTFLLCREPDISTWR